MYEMADQSWRTQPRLMSRSVAEQAAARIGEHVRAHGLDEIVVVFHGGEPLLAGPESIAHGLEAVRASVGPGVKVRACVQTNGTGLNEEYLELFRKLDVRVGVSLDGGPDEQNRHRRYANGRGSYDAVAAGLRRLTQQPYRHLFSGLLCVIDIRNDPLKTYAALMEFEPPRMDFLLPHGTWESPPPGRDGAADETPYADWLISVFDHWYADPRTQVRLFSETIRLMLGLGATTESVGLAPARFLVIETDGAMAQVDSLKATFHGAAATGLHVGTSSFDDALLLPEIAARQIGYDALSSSCRQCRIWRTCGGGLYAHRYRPGSGFANPSVYCPDLMRLIDHIRARVSGDVAASLAKREAGA
jgi:uncharacterized protein